MLYLASQSPRRSDLLRSQDIDFQVIPNKLDPEPDFTDSYANPAAYVAHLSQLKAQLSADHYKGLILGADTIVVLDANILGKPASKQQAFDWLQSMQGRSHHVISAFTLFDTRTVRMETNTTAVSVSFSSTKDEFIWDYLNNCEFMDKAGGYGIQDLGPYMEYHLEGSMSAVMGLDIDRLTTMLEVNGYSNASKC